MWPQRKLIMAAVNGRGLSELVPGVAGVMARHVAGWAQAGRVELFQAVSRQSAERVCVRVCVCVCVKKREGRWYEGGLGPRVAAEVLATSVVSPRYTDGTPWHSHATLSEATPD